MPDEYPLYQDGRGKWLLPWDGPIVGAIGVGRDAAALSFPLPTGGVFERDRFFEQAALTFPFPDGGEYRSTFVELGTIKTDEAALSFPLPAAGDYRETFLPLGTIKNDEAALSFPLPSGGDYAIP